MRKRFDLTGINEAGYSIHAAETAKLVDKHRRKLVEDARQRRVMTALLRLGSIEPSFDADSFIIYVDGRGAFTPSQLAMIFWRFQSTGIPYKPRDYKVTIRRGREKGQLRTMPRAALARIWPAFTAEQKDSIRRIKARFEENGGAWR